MSVFQQSYAAVTFDVYQQMAGVAVGGGSEGNVWAPLFIRKPNITKRHLPGSNVDDVQASGLGNQRVVLRAFFQQLADYQTMIGAIGATQRTLSYGGQSYPNVMLVNVGQGQIASAALNLPLQAINAELTFVQVSG